MEAQTSANVLLDSRQLANLEQEDLEIWWTLAAAEPVLDIGSVWVSQGARLMVPRNLVWFAMDLHEVGEFGAVNEVTEWNNELALGRGDSVISRWTPKGYPAFRVVSDCDGSGEASTRVFLESDVLS